MKIREIKDEITEAVFPSNIYCAVCGSLIDRSRPYALCDSCLRQMHWITGRTCVKCGKALQDTYRGGDGNDGGNLCYDCMSMEHFFERGWSCLTYGMHEREIMMDIKYNGRGFLASKMGNVLFDRMEKMASSAQNLGIRPFDIAVPVPVSSRRISRRGYNQSELMAIEFVRRWQDSFENAPVLDTDVLVREKETVMLRSLNPSERRLALADAFGVESESKEKIRDKTVLLIDDIYTTGATADACSLVLKQGGAEAVYLLTLCSGGNRAPCI